MVSEQIIIPYDSEKHPISLETAERVSGLSRGAKFERLYDAFIVFEGIKEKADWNCVWY